MKKYFSLIALITIVQVGIAQSGIPEGEPSTAAQSVVKVKVFPNPATNVVNILGLANTPKADISILDIYGNTVWARQWAVRRNALNIPIAELKPGPYIIRIHSEENQVRTKFYKQ